MKALALKVLIEVIEKVFGEEILKTLADKFLDIIEDFVHKTETELDDKIVGRACQLVRATFDIPDND